MNAASEALFVGKTLEKLAEPFLFFLGQHCQEFLLVVARDFSDQFHSVETLLCEVKGMPSPIIGISAALDKPFRLQFIEQGNEPTGHNPEAGDELPLGH